MDLERDLELDRKALMTEEHEDDPEQEVAAAIAEGDLPPHYFDLFQLMVESADGISARRGTANAFFLTINTALIALLGSQTLRWYVPVAGVVFAVAWWKLLQSYRQLNAAKFSVINGMEERLPRRVFAEEYEHYTNVAASPVSESETRLRGVRRWARRYRELGEVERFVPAAFAGLYLAELMRQLT